MESILIGISDVTVSLAILVISLLAVAFFSSSEASLLYVSKIRIRHLAESGSRAAQSVQRVLRDHDRFFATILFTENLFIIFATSVGTALALDFFGEGGVLVATLVMTLLIVTFGEITPKTLAAQAAERYSLVASRPIELIIWLLRPVIWVFTLFPKLVRRLGGQPPFLARHPPVTEAELRMLINIGEAEGTLEKEEGEMLQRVFEFGDRQVREVMIPRPEIVALDQEETVGAFLAEFAQAPHSRFPVYSQDIDNINGVISIKDVLRALAQGTVQRESPLQPLVRPAHFVPETKPIGALLTEMQSRSQGMAIVIDEYGGTAGLVTLEELLEEIVGRLGDELAANVPQVETIDERTVQVEADMRIDEVNEQLALQLPPGPYETLAGFILNLLGHIPQEGEQVAYHNLMLVVTQVRGVKIEKVLIAKGALPR